MDIKGTLTTICAIIIAIGGALIPVLLQGAWHPAWIITVLSVLVAVSTALIGVFTGRNADGSKKTAAQVTKQTIEKDSL